MAGPDQIKKYLSKAIYRKRLTHAILLIGENPSLLNVTHHLAMTLLCEHCHPEDDEVVPCRICKDCVRIKENSHLNLLWIHPESSKEIKIDQIRDVRERLRLSNLNDKPQIVVFTNADSFTKQAANALLKSIEEPNPNQFFLLLASNAGKVQSTLISRCNRLFISERAPENHEEDLVRWATEFVHKVQKNDLFLRSQLVDDFLKHPSDKSILLSEIRSLLHKQMRLETSRSHRICLINSIEATDQAYDFISQHVNPQLAIENWLLRSWPC